ncbi:stage II sporulation protein D [Paenibacillus lutrae]|uniref:Stage II sporulation protein D n=1 Tax=Paenibacillus lutrae TaxID=2078573 RepID=A0A7X3FLK3_9BACL|nr:stage II sporulation protein D [Paenibacillus lutrae]MVP01517.1 stage II sporulation protein D [Paenibacillus lutrae]
MKFKKRSKPIHPAILWTTLVCSGLLFVTILIPALLVSKEDTSTEMLQEPEAGGADVKPVMVPIYLSKQQQVRTVSLEEYVRGVVAAEMPADFSPEALKAQAMAARTYMVRRILEKDFSNVPVKEAWVTDTIQHQAYATEEQLHRQWTGSSYETNFRKIEAAVKATEGKIITYSGRPIQATFFSTSNGYTENAKEVWGSEVPYLKSVVSPWDAELSPKFKQNLSFSYKDVLHKMGLPNSNAAAGSESVRILERTGSKRVKKVSIGGKTFSGREVREKLGLNSTDFEVTGSGSSWTFKVSGYGHGVGMSQWGANGMALDGKKAEEIIAYYYAGTQIAVASSLLNQLELQ